MFRIVPRSLFIKLGWTTFSYGTAQVLRLLNNIILARLLAPPLFGLMLIVNTIRTGIELLSDVGINQNIIRHERGDTPIFYDTAWTLQALRGIVLAAICFLSGGVAARYFGVPELATILPVASLFFLFTGFDSVARFLLQKKLAIARFSLFEITIAVLSLLIHVALALITPTIWALILGSVFAGAITLVASFLLMPGIRHRFVIDRPSLRELLLFGRWIFVSSIIYFAAMNFDRLYLAKHISLGLLGVFGIARTLADTISLFVNRCSSMILFPLVAAMRGTGPEIRGRLRNGRRTLLLATAIGLAGFTALGDRIVGLLYDARYAEAGLMLPVLAIGTWFAVMSSINDSILIGLGHPRLSAAGNAAKLLAYVVGVPIALTRGLDAAIVALSIGEIARYLTLWISSRGEGLGFARDDLPLTLVFLGCTVAFRTLLHAAGLTSGLDGLFPFAFALLR